MFYALLQYIVQLTGSDLGISFCSLVTIAFIAFILTRETGLLVRKFGLTGFGNGWITVEACRTRDLTVAEARS